MSHALGSEVLYGRVPTGENEHVSGECAVQSGVVSGWGCGGHMT